MAGEQAGKRVTGRLWRENLQVSKWQYHLYFTNCPGPICPEPYLSPAVVTMFASARLDQWPLCKVLLSEKNICRQAGEYKIGVVLQRRGQVGDCQGSSINFVIADRRRLSRPPTKSHYVIYGWTLNQTSKTLDEVWGSDNYDQTRY